MNKFEIPVNQEIRQFGRHLKANERTILSARFGDGKSYFLDKIRSDKGLAKKYKFLTIYPINYQVSDNKDVFELLKRDVLLQLILNEMIDDSVKLEEIDILSWFIYHNRGSVLTDLLTSLPQLGLDDSSSEKVAIAMNTISVFSSIKTQFGAIWGKYKAFKEQLKSNDDLIEEYMSKQDKTLLYEKDSITTIIQDSIKTYQSNTKKKVALIVEDLDRIDPAHLFRILNILSAHMDYGYRYHGVPDKSLAGNKFGLDNIIIVADYKNLKNIFHHFYGNHTDFGGYISKFLSSVPFEYSLEKLKYQHIINKISSVTGIETSILYPIIPQVELSSTLRKTVQSFSIGKSDLYKLTVNIQGKQVKIDNKVFKLMSVLKRLNYSKEATIQRIQQIEFVNQEYYFEHVIPIMFLSEKNEESNEQRMILIKDKQNGLIRRRVGIDTQRGTAYTVSATYAGAQERLTDMRGFLERLYNMIP